MRPEERESPAEVAPTRPHGMPWRPHWRAVLEARWQERVREVTELSLAYHDAAAAPDYTGARADADAGGGDGGGSGSGGDDGVGGGGRRAEVLLHRTVAARRKLADIEEALERLAAGGFGSCEQCGSAIPAGLLAIVPESRYCPRCDAPTGRAYRPPDAGGPPDAYGSDAYGADAYGADAAARLSLR